MRLLLFLLTVLVSTALAARADAAPPSNEPAARPLIFQYVTPYDDHGVKLASVEVLSPEQMTVDAAQNPLFDGITLILPWSKLEPTEGQIDASILDQAIDYWGKKGKKIVLNVAPVTFPTELGSTWGGQMDNGVPKWVMARCEKHVVKTRLLVSPEEKQGPFAMPCPWDPQFKKAYYDFVARLGRKYDGNPVLAAVRIGMGMEGEEQYLIPDIGFTNQKWYRYVTGAVKAYLAAFTRTPLEIDLSWAGYAEIGSQKGRLAKFNIGGADKPDVDALMTLLKQNHLTVGNNGWRGSEGYDPSVTSIMSLLENYRAGGNATSLEVGGAFHNPRMWDTAELLRKARLISPSRINFMGDTASIVNDAKGISNPSDKVSQESWAHLPGGADPKKLAVKVRNLILNLRQIDTSKPPPSPASLPPPDPLSN
jgi:hypothetical protein